MYLAGGIQWNRYKYNGIELDTSFGIDDYETKLRELDPQTGRWWQVDPKIEQGQENASPYASNFDDPIRYDDPNGDCPACEAVLEAAVQPVARATAAYVTGETISASSSQELPTLNGLVNDVNSLQLGYRVQGVINDYANFGLSVGTIAVNLYNTVVNKIEGNSESQNSQSQSSNGSSSSHTTKEQEITIKDEDKIDRAILHPPTTPGNAPTFKKDGTPVEIHHEGQNAEGPFKEMHKEDHRLGDNYRKNHPAGQKPLTKEERATFNRQRTLYWLKEYAKKQ